LFVYKFKITTTATPTPTATATTTLSRNLLDVVGPQVQDLIFAAL
jgi:hypothetical protein